MVRAGWDDDASNDVRIRLYDPRREGLNPRKKLLPQPLNDGFVTPELRVEEKLDPAVEKLEPLARQNEARRLVDLLHALPGVGPGQLKAFTERVRDAAQFQIRMSPEALL